MAIDTNMINTDMEERINTDIGLILNFAKPKLEYKRVVV